MGFHRNRATNKNIYHIGTAGHRWILTRVALTFLQLMCLVVVGCSSGGSTGADAQAPVTNPDNSSNIDPALNAGRDIRPESQALAFHADSPYADKIKECALISGDDYQTSCKVAEYPFIGLENPEYTIDDIMDRVLVSHTWMGTRFERLLRDAPADLIGMFGSATGIVIASDIRPSNYRSWTGSIRIDPRYLWASVAEKNTVEVKDDYRSNFGAELDFRFYSEFVNGDSLAYNYFLLTDDSTRTYAELQQPFYALLYHELSHANDYTPREHLGSIDTSLSIYEANSALYEEQGGIRLLNLYPIIDTTLKDLADVRFGGTEPTEEQKLITPAHAGTLIADDGALEFYSYRSAREDYANLVEATMMQLHFGNTYNIGFTTNPDSEYWTCKDLVVGWGVRNRLGNSYIALRAQFAVGAAIESTPAISAFFNSDLGLETPMRAGDNWCSNRVANPPQAVSARDLSPRVSPVEREIDMTLPEERMR